MFPRGLSMESLLIFVPIVLFLVFLIGLSLWVERAGRQKQFAGEYFLGDRSLKGFVLAMTLVATYGSVSSFVSGPGVAWQLGGRQKQFAGEYFLGDRSLKGFVLAMTLVATYGSVSSFVSGPGVAWQLGLGWVVFAAPQIIAGFLILGVAGKKMAIVSRAVGAITVIDLIRAPSSRVL